jgi:class 3 adenylate cyclase
MIAWVSSVWKKLCLRPCFYLTVVVLVCMLLFTVPTVERRQKKVMKSAVRTNDIVSSLFPSNVRDRLFPSEQDGDQQKNKHEQNKLRIKNFLSDGKSVDARSKEEEKDRGPIADLFPNCTVLFSDIAGFTAWSSVREPSQVFTLLETLYGAIDATAMKRGVFKVETIGDSYVAVVGLPEPREDHAVVMAKFARDCRLKMMEIVQNLEKTLGPGTADLKLRFGLHSGPVTAGVLRGQKSRFQLFGDTVNTASRMESTGCPNKIQASRSTAELLIAAGKTSWVKPREALVEAKGKGKMQTYWIEPKLMGITANATSDLSDPSSEDVMVEKTRRLVDWNTEVLAQLLKQVIARRSVSESFLLKKPSPPCIACIEGMTILDEVTEIVAFPEVNPATYIEEKELNADLFSQLHDYVIAISNLYNNNPFHNFDHASHVGMSVAKLLGRMVVPPEEEERNRKIGPDYAYGITSDPSTLFACVYSALIHDIDHPGVPNSRLIHVNSPLATQYRGKSIAEQNSVDIAWDLLMQEQYNALRDAICPTEQDLKRFRQLVINIVMATDIVDSDLGKVRDDRWDKAFSESCDESERDRANRRATVVIEHMIQISDVAHTMQHWNVYCKWNEKLFEELYFAYVSGRADKDPSEFWYQGELEFFDSFVLPLARKLRDSGIFGVSSDEYLAYATRNREAWELRGRDVVASMVEKCTDSSSASA